ncbi:MAG: hypothetical protein N4A33_00800 [Bacteriovoracaceae bacterium]|jgi:hypothetical protein|nr:hypothetical protein [Bacteriovoracaceae bacterium]
MIKFFVFLSFLFISCSKDAQKSRVNINLKQLATSSSSIIHLVGQERNSGKIMSRILKHGQNQFTEFIDDGVWDFKVYIYNHSAGTSTVPFDYNSMDVTSRYYCGQTQAGGYDTSSGDDVIINATTSCSNYITFDTFINGTINIPYFQFTYNHNVGGSACPSSSPSAGSGANSSQCSFCFYNNCSVKVSIYAGDLEDSSGVLDHTTSNLGDYSVCINISDSNNLVTGSLTSTYMLPSQLNGGSVFLNSYKVLGDSLVDNNLKGVSFYQTPDCNGQGGLNLIN